MCGGRLTSAVGMERQGFIIDTDAGIDDAQALFAGICSKSDQQVIVAITCVHGNVPLDLVVGNVCAVTDVTSAREIPVFRGADRPLLDAHRDASYWHGSDGLGNTGYGLKAPQEQVQPEHASLAMYRLASQWKAGTLATASTRQHANHSHPHSAAEGASAWPSEPVSSSIKNGPLTIVTLGPLTNLALAVRMNPSLTRLVDRVVVMGGSYQAVGNANLVSEFNVWQDPEAASIVFSAFPRVTLVTWELTMRSGLSPAFVERWMDGSTIKSQWLGAVSGHLIELSAKSPDYSPLGLMIPDPLAVVVALRPDVVRVQRKRRVVVELAGTHTRGMTIVDWEGRTSPSTTATAAGAAGVNDSASAAAEGDATSAKLGFVVGPNVEIVEEVDMGIVQEMLLKSVQ